MAFLGGSISTFDALQAGVVRKPADRLPCWCVQLAKKQANERSNLTLLKAPVRTLYYFSRYTISSATSGLQWFASHPFTIFLLLPAVAIFALAKYNDYQPGILTEIEVRRCSGPV